MPLQYKIEYRWEDKLAQFRKARARGRKGSRPQHQPVPADRAERAGDGEGDWSGGGGESGEGGTERMRPVASRHVVEKVVLPAGYCLYYARGRGTPLLQADPQQGRPVRSSSKGLGVINPDSHNVVEEEYAIIREVVEIYLEEQVAEDEEQEEGGSSHVTDPRLEQQRALLDDLRVTLPEDHGTVQLRSEASPLQDDDPGSQPDAVIRSLDTSRSFPATARVNGRCLLPISKALRANISPRGPFLMEGQSVLDTGREGFPRQRPQDQQPEAFSRQASDDSAELPEDHVDRSEGPSHDDHRGDRAADNPLVSHFRSVTSPLPPMVAVKQKTQQLEVKYGLIRSVSYRHQRNTRYDRFRRKRFLSSRPMCYFLPNRPEASLLVVSERSPLLEHRKQDAVRSMARVPKKIVAPSTKDVFSSPKPVFRGAVKGEAIDGALPFWKPRACQPHDPRSGNGGPAAVVTEVGETDGHSSVTQMPSRLVLDVVLPREIKSREKGGPPTYHHHRHLTATGVGLRRPVPPPPLPPPPVPDWMSSSSPPPPPPPSAPTDGDDPGDDIPVFLHRQGVGEDGDVDTPHSCWASCCSTAYLSSSSSSSRDGAGEEGQPVTRIARDNDNASSSRLVHAHQSSAVSGGQVASPAPAASTTTTTTTVPGAADPLSASRQPPHPHPHHVRITRATTPVCAAMTRGCGNEPAHRSVARPAQHRHHQQTPMPCPRALQRHDVLDCEVSADCRTTQHRHHSNNAQQSSLIPDISATPRRPLAAPHGMKGRRAKYRGDNPQGPSLSGPADGSWPHCT